MSLLAWYNRCTLLMLLLAISSYATASRAPEFAVLAMPAVFALWRLSCRRSGRFLLPRLVVNILLIAVIAYAVLRSQGNFAVETIAQVVVLIQIVKIGDRRAPRDDAQILSLAVFLAIAAMLDSNGLWTGIQLAVFLPVMVITVMLFQLFKAAHAAGAIRRDDSTDMTPGMRRQLRFTSGIATLGTMGLALLVFVLLPRGVGANVFPSFGMQRDGRQMAFTSNVTLGGKGIISDSPTIVFDLVLRDESGSNVGGLEFEQYLRGAALTDYDGRGRWSIPQNRTVSPDKVVPKEQPVRSGRPPGLLIYQTVSLHGTPGRNATGYLFSLWRPTSFNPKREVTIWNDPYTHVYKFQTDPGPFEYTMTSVVNDFIKESTSQERVRRYDSAPMLELASSILKQAEIDPDPSVRPPDEDARATRLIQDYLRGNFEYTLEIEPPAPDQDPIEFFLFERKKGHCEYFAAAMVLLCRSVGIEARMITGYLATEFNSTTGAYIVRESNAHAWVEADVGAQSWRRFDPTPPGDLMRIHKPTLGLLGRLRHAMEAVEYAWNSSVVSFDESARQQILGPSEGEHAGLLARIDRFTTRFRNTGLSVKLQAALNGIVVFATVASAGMVLRFLSRLLSSWIRRRSGRSATGVLIAAPADARFYRDLLRYLSRAGLAKPPWRPPLEHAAALAIVNGPLSEDVRQVVDRYYELRFGGNPARRDERSRLASALQRIRRFRPRAR